MKKLRVGIFGGTFNPPHIGHVEAAKAFVKEANLDELIVMPAFIPPHKEFTSTVSGEQRLTMCTVFLPLLRFLQGANNPCRKTPLHLTFPLIYLLALFYRYSFRQKLQLT